MDVNDVWIHTPSKPSKSVASDLGSRHDLAVNLILEMGGPRK